MMARLEEYLSVFWNKKKARERDMARRADLLEERAIERPFEAIEVDLDLAGHMGAFIEDAVGPDDFYELEEEVFEELNAQEQLTGKGEE